MANLVCYSSQFYRVPDWWLADEAPASAQLARVCGRNLNAIKAACVCPRVVDDHTAVVGSSGATTTTATMIVDYPEVEVPAGYLHIIGKIRARKQSSASVSPTMTLYSDLIGPVTPTATAVSSSAASSTITVGSYDFQWYDFTVRIVRNAQHKTCLSLWSTNGAAGASRCPEFTDLDLWVQPLLDDGTVRGLVPSTGMTWR